MKKQPFIVAHSTQKDTRKAMDEVLQVLDDQVQFALLYVDEHYDADRIVSEMNRRFPHLAWVGCTTSGEITSSGLQEEGIALMACTDMALQVKVAFAANVKNHPEEAAKLLAKQLKDPRFDAVPHHAVIVHTPGFTVQESGWEHKLFPQLQKLLGTEVALVGGSAGDNLKFLGSRVLSSKGAHEDGVVALRLGGQRKMAATVCHGYKPTSKTATVTRSKNNEVIELDGKPASRRFAELVGASEKDMLTGVSLVKMGGFLPKKLTALGQKFGMTPKRMIKELPFYKYSVQYPFGRKVEGTEHYSTYFAKLIQDGGSIEFYGDMPVGTKLTLMERDDALFLSAESKALKTNQEKLGGKSVANLIVECAGRKILLEDKIEDVFQQATKVSNAPTIGFYAHGEQGSFDADPVSCNNYSVMVLSFGK
jgi:hypothetical protein